MRITQSAVFLKNLLSDVQRGDIVPASFQRPYVWSKADVLALLTSINKGYPLGSAMTWMPASDIAQNTVGGSHLGPIPVSNNRGSLLLDGQNRLVSLAWMAHQGPVPDHDYSYAEREVWMGGESVVFMLDTGEFKFVTEQEAAASFCMPAYTLMDSRKGLALTRQYWSKEWAGLPDEVKDNGLRRYDLAAQAFSDARLVLTHMEGATVDEAKHAFMHVCRTGVPMSEADFDRALAWAA